MTNAGKSPGAPLTTCVGLLRERLHLIETKMIELIDCSTIEVFEDDPRSEVIVIAPKHHWGKPDNRQLRLQMELKGLYADWFEQLQLLLSDATEAVSREVAEVDSFIRRWIEKQSCWDLSSNMEENKAHFRKHLEIFRGALTMLGDPAAARPVLVPDTNALIRCPEPAEYAVVPGGGAFDFVLLPTVLGELDDLKTKHRDEAFRDKVEGVIRRIKGWRTQGDLLAGVTVHKTVTVRAVAREPDFRKTLHWLDKDNRDDRIIASVLDLQRTMPTAPIVLVTGDINLQNKAAAANVPYAEPPAAKTAPPKPWEGVVLEEDGELRYFDWGLRMLGVEYEEPPLAMTEEFQEKVCELLWELQGVSPAFTQETREVQHWVYETERERKSKRKLRAHFGGQYLVAAPRREAPPPRCPECGKRCSRGANFCPRCMEAGKTIRL